MALRFTYKGDDYWVDDEGNIHGTMGIVGHMEKDGRFKIMDETGYISSGDVYSEEFMWGGLFTTYKKVGEVKAGCFLTTACVEYAGLPDDCFELQTMRKFRDEYIRSLPDGESLIEEYYQAAPLIVQRIKSSSDAEATFERLLRILRNVIELIQAGRNSEALLVCKKEFQMLKHKYGV